MSGADQVRLATDIAAQFRHLDEDAAVAAVVAHIRTFWAPSMRAQLTDVGRDRPEALDPIVRAAAGQLDEDSAAV